MPPCSSVVSVTAISFADELMTRMPSAPPAGNGGMGERQKSTAISNKSITNIAAMGIDLGKNSFHAADRDTAHHLSRELQRSDAREM
jgi:hypothetical protein